MPSSVIDIFHYDEKKSELRIKYRSGWEYIYKKVPPEVYHALKIAGSKGRYLNFFIKGKFAYERIK